jgi:hypothetical protein
MSLATQREKDIMLIRRARSLGTHGFVDLVATHWEPIALGLLFVAGFLLRALPLLQFPHVSGDPFLHYKYSMALLEGKLSVPVEAGSSGATVDLYYPPLFHLFSLISFLAFPNVDPYAIMKILASGIDALQVIPIYLIVKHVSRSGAAGIIASYALLVTRSDYQMLSWGGYANIMGLLMFEILVYALLADKLILSAVSSATLGLTHQLSTLFAVAVVAPYFVVLLWRKRIRKSVLGALVGGSLAFVTFYQFALESMYYYYSNFTPLYDQSLYVTPYMLELVGPLLLLCAAVGIVLLYAKDGRKWLNGKEILAIWTVVPFVLAYAYLLGVQWHGVRWIHFMPQPLAVWTGTGVAPFLDRKLVLVGLAAIFTVQLILTLQGYWNDILLNVIT